MFNTALWLFGGLLFLFIWRGIAGWRCCGRFLRYFNYMSLLLVLIFVILVYDSFAFAMAFTGPRSLEWDSTPGWLKFIVYLGPFVVWINYALGAHQVFQHMVSIREESAVLRHDRAVQIIVLPTVYGAMCMSCLTKCYAYLLSDHSAVNAGANLAVVQAETCLWIGDLYESWALYQFGVLSLEVMESSLIRQSNSKDSEERAAANALIVAHGAVTRLAWLGIMSFVLVSVADSAVALWYLTVGADTPNFVSRFNNAETQFNAAGFLASCAAIFNVYVVEQTFHHFLEDFHPFLKFLTVKILVSFAYCQLLFFDGLQDLYNAWPLAFRTKVDDIPVLGALCKFNEPEFYAFYSALLIVECFLIAIMHMWAWGNTESWYDDDEEEELMDRSSEQKLLMPGQRVLYGSDV